MKKNLLVLAPVLPLHDRDSGSFRLYQMLKLWIGAGHSITYIARGAAGDAPPQRYIDDLTRLGIKVHPIDPEKLRACGVRIEGPSIDLGKILLDDRPFDAAYHYHYFIAEHYIDEIRALSPWTKQIVDSVDVHYLREAREAEIKDNPALRDAALRTKARELALYRKADEVVVVTEPDGAVLRMEIPELSVRVIPNLHPLPESTPDFSDRTGFLFVGGFGHTPNVDAVVWFHDAIWPRIADAVPDVKAYIVGGNPPEAVTRLTDARFVVTGFVPDTAPYLDRCRVSVAPLRYGAGMKGKVGEAMAAGLPVVGTTVAFEGMGIGSDAAHATDDAEAFIARAIELHTSEDAWRQASDAGRAFIEALYSIEAVRPSVLGALDTPATDFQAVGAQLKRRRNYRSALAAFRGIVAESADAVLVDTADCLANLGQTGEAEDLYRRAESNPAHRGKALAGLGVLSLVRNHQDEARGFFERAIAESDPDGTASCGLGILLAAEGRTADAKERFLAALASNPSNVVAVHEVTKASYADGDFETAETAIRRFLDFDPLNAPLLFSLAATLAKRGQPDEARKTLDRLALVAPGYPGADELEKALYESPNRR